MCTRSSPTYASARRPRDVGTRASPAASPLDRPEFQKAVPTVAPATSITLDMPRNRHTCVLAGEGRRETLVAMEGEAARALSLHRLDHSQRAWNVPPNRPNRVLAGDTRTGHASGMTSEQRDFLRNQIDAQMRERVERARSAKEQAKMAALERQMLEEAASADRLPDDVDVEVVGGEGLGEDHRREALREAREAARRSARRRLQKVFDEGHQTVTRPTSSA